MTRRSDSRQGIFITFEGPDGAGKTTQAKYLASLIRSNGGSAILTREPGGTYFGDRVRSILLDPETGEINPLTELLLYESIRAHHVETVIRPALGRGVTVISDRFTDASIAYQGHGRGIPISIVKTLNRIATSGLVPDVTVLIDVNPDSGLRSARGSHRDEAAGGSLDRIESAGRAFHRRVRHGYHDLAKAAPGRILLLKRRRTPESTFREVVRLLGERRPALRPLLA
jgi:dTMP kinase